MARKPGMTRDDLLFKNAEIVGGVVDQVVARSKSAILILVTNPLDAMVQLAWKKSRFAPHRVIGMAGILHSPRLPALLPRALPACGRKVTPVFPGGPRATMGGLPRD